jgi:hypothetical protein
MASFRATLTVPESGRITLDSLPFQAGEQVEILVESAPAQPHSQGRFPLRGTPYNYDHPFDPAIPPEEWGVHQ